MNPLAIYIHYPFCKAKCPYCDFNSHVRTHIDHQAFLVGYQQELQFFANNIGTNHTITSIFFGGGTPSLMPIFLVDGILQQIQKIWQLASDCEITLEANPTSCEAEKFAQLASIGINRLSLGIQAINQNDLQFLGREHSVQEAMQAISDAARYFNNFSFDLIYARPEQTLQSWQQELEFALGFCSKHLSLYQLTIEKGTPFFSAFNNKKFTLPGEELSADLYQLTSDICLKNGLSAYEISNYAKDGYACKHNLAYWQGQDYIGIGAGAHSRFHQNQQRFATANFCQPEKWLQTVQNNSAWQHCETIDTKSQIEELLLTGLRLKKGVAIKQLESIAKKDISNIFDRHSLLKLQKQQLISIDECFIAINKTLLTNQIIYKLINIQL